MVAFEASTRYTYESDEEKHDLEAPSDGGDAGNVSVADRRHGDHEEVDALPVGELLAVVEVRRVAGVLQLRGTRDGREGLV